jgi:hypothetical protein
MKIIEGIFLLVILLFLYALFIWAPYNMYADSACLNKGYPDYRVTIGLEVYCLNLDGSVTVNVEKL